MKRSVFATLLLLGCSALYGEELPTNWEYTLQAYLEDYQNDPNDPEPLLKIAIHYREQGLFHPAYLFAKHGSLIQSDPTDHRLDEEISISAFYTPFKDEGYQAADRVILNKHAPASARELAYRNMLFYVPDFKNNAQYYSLGIKLAPTREGSELTYNPMNASILKTEKGYKLVCRTVNYFQNKGKDFKLLDSGDVSNRFMTKNYLVHCDQDFKVLSQKEIIENLPRQKFRWWNAEGIEDCRLFEFENGLWATCTTCDTNPTGNRQMALCKFADAGSGETVNVEKLIPLVGPNPHRCEKNWLPIIRDNALQLIYSYDPFVVYKPDMDTGVSETVENYIPDHDFSQFRGSAAPIAFEDGYLMLVHETIPLPDYERRYTHRFVYMDKDLHITKVSRPFIFRHSGVEFCCGMVIDHSGTKLVMPIGIEDQEAFLCVVELNTVRSMLYSPS